MTLNLVESLTLTSLEKEFSITTEGQVLVPQETKRPSAAGAILAAISDPTVSIGDSSRLITIEIASVYSEVAKLADDPMNTSRLRSLNDQCKMLRELQKSLSESDSLSKKDVLSFDGPKFSFVLVQIFNFFKKALTDAGVEDAFAQNIMKQFSDILKMNEEKLRRDTANVV